MSTTTLYALVLGGCAVAIVGAIIGMRLLSQPPKKTPVNAVAAAEPPPDEPRFSDVHYKATIKDDFALYKVAPMDLTELAKPLLYASELSAPRRMKTNETIETDHLRLKTSIIKEWATTSTGQGFRYEHLALDITNKTDRPLAYRVVTEVGGNDKNGPDKCKSKAVVQHNSMVVAANDTVQRTECLFHPGASLLIKSVEILEVTPLGAAYLSRITPSGALYDPRTASGHATAKEIKPCAFVPWREIDADQQKGGSWADFADFYARHNCAEFSYYPGYRRWTKPGVLPAHQ